MSFDAAKRRKSLNSGAKACEQPGGDGSSFAQATKHPGTARLVATPYVELANYCLGESMRPYGTSACVSAPYATFAYASFWIRRICAVA